MPFCAIDVCLCDIAFQGVPFDIDDAMFNPPMPRPTSEYSLEHHQPYQLPTDQALQQLQEAVAQTNPTQVSFHSSAQICVMH